MKESEYITGFLAYMREVITRLNIATANELEANAQTQDILHRLESCCGRFGGNAGLQRISGKCLLRLWIG